MGGSSITFGRIWITLDVGEKKTAGSKTQTYRAGGELKGHGIKLKFRMFSHRAGQMIIIFKSKSNHIIHYISNRIISLYHCQVISSNKITITYILNFKIISFIVNHRVKSLSSNSPQRLMLILYFFGDSKHKNRLVMIEWSSPNPPIAARHMAYGISISIDFQQPLPWPRKAEHNCRLDTPEGVPIFLELVYWAFSGWESPHRVLSPRSTLDLLEVVGKCTSETSSESWLSPKGVFMVKQKVKHHLQQTKGTSPPSNLFVLPEAGKYNGLVTFHDLRGHRK